MTLLWKDIEGYEGLYKISENGDIWSEYSKKIRKTTTGTTEYHRVTLNKDGESKHFNIHRLVAMSFVKNPYNKKYVNHIDENKNNNHYSNLEWCTQKENVNWGTRNKRIKETRKVSSKWKEYHKKRKDKLSIPIVGVNIDSGEVIEFKSASEAGRNGFSSSSVWMCLKDRQSKHKGYKWFYKQ